MDIYVYLIYLKSISAIVYSQPQTLKQPYSCSISSTYKTD
jgi:hypothetical protein